VGETPTRQPAGRWRYFADARACVMRQACVLRLTSNFSLATVTSFP